MNKIITNVGGACFGAYSSSSNGKLVPLAGPNNIGCLCGTPFQPCRRSKAYIVGHVQVDRPVDLEAEKLVPGQPGVLRVSADERGPGNGLRHLGDSLA